MTPPIEPYVKINVDVAFDASTGRASSGVVVRDSNNLVLGSCVLPTTNISSSFVAEALAAVQGLRFTLDLGCTHVVLESDSFTIISKLMSVEDDLSVLQPYISYPKAVSQAFASCHFPFMPISGNDVVHCLARLGNDSDDNSFWVEKSLPKFPLWSERTVVARTL
ncbi:hypothetical protein V6N12_002936 [Hibiscus sabdariffa]|uniref:RNase H type-1 domain-containing protein n=1 Tax=Hibiscus sabdariffa TaxID=183260 RepID=A0ABR2EAF2_9ROSI